MLLLAALASAATVTIDITLPEGAEELGLNEAELEESMRSAIGEQLHIDDIGGYMDQMADANVLAAKGMGVDYGSDMQRFAFGGAFGTAVNGAGAAIEGGDGALPEAGFALQIGLMAGLNLGAFSPKESALRRFKIYVNGMSATTERAPFSGTFLNYGAHAQIKIVKGGDKTDGVRWGGLDFTGGYEYSSYTLALSQELPVEQDPMVWNATGTYSITAESQSLPAELSTNLHIFVVTAFLGAGFDYNLSGTASSTIGVEGPIEVSVNGEKQNAGTAAASLTGSGVASPYTPRAFVGLQADIFMVHVYAQMNVTLDESVGGHVGVRVVF